MLLELSNVWIRYGSRLAASAIDIRVPEAALVALVGANGAGKSTILRAISGLVPIANGDILFDGKSLKGVQPHKIARQGIGHIVEGRGVLTTMTVEENLRLGLLGLELDANPYEAAFAYFPVLRQRLNIRAGALSGGEQQMLSISRALLKRPRLMMIDEMSLGLAPKVVQQILEVVVDLTAKGASVLCVEQNTRLILPRAEYAYVLQTGRIVMEGNGTELLHNKTLSSKYLGESLLEVD